MNEQPRAECELFSPGHYGCPGCGATLAMRQALDALGEDTIVVMPAGCWSTVIGIYPYSNLNVPVMSVAFPTTAATASGVKTGLSIQGNEHTTVLAWAGDGGTFDIGFQALSGAVERNDDILYVCYDNEAYMNTGIQRSSATPAGAWTTTTPDSVPKKENKKNIVEIMAAHRIPYTATASIGAPEDFRRKLEMARRIRGARFIHLFASCPTGWRHAPDLTVEVSRLAIQSRVFPLYEVFEGERWELNPMPEKIDVERYVKLQGRFRTLTPEALQRMQEQVDREWRVLQGPMSPGRKGELIMPMMTAREYEDSLRKLNLNVYMFGQKIENVVDDPIIRPSMNAVAKTYELAHDPRYQDVMTAQSHLTGQRINRFTHIHQSVDDLVMKSKMGRLLGRETGCCFQRCVGMDALNSLSIVTFNIDQKTGSEYNKRFLKYLAYVQENDLVCDGAMTDTKGDRSLSPHQQPDPDQYLHVVDRNDEGIVVRGAKAHQTGAVNSHEIIVMPTISMKEEDKDYAVSFALPSDSPGIVYIMGRQSCDTRKMEGCLIDQGNEGYGGHEALVVFDDVFVPWERVFMCGESEFAGQLVEMFAAYHRQSYACKVGVGDVLIGAAQLAAEYNGVAKASHIKDKIVEMNHLNETLYCGCIACASEGRKKNSGTYMVNTLLANVHKHNVTRFPYEISRLAQDIAGGLMVTLPSEKDLHAEPTRKWMEKYLKAQNDVPTEHRMRVLRLIENLTLGTAAVGYLTESMHGAGSPQAQRIMISRLAKMETKKNAARKLCGIESEAEVESD